MRYNHPAAGRYDAIHGDEPRDTGPVFEGATVERLDNEVDRLTEERDMLRDALQALTDYLSKDVADMRPPMDAKYAALALAWIRGSLPAIQARAALAKLEDES